MLAYLLVMNNFIEFKHEAMLDTGNYVKMLC